MQLSVDTSKDSKEDIKRMIRFLQDFIDANTNEIAKQDTVLTNEITSAGFSQIFGSDASQPKAQTIQIFDADMKEESSRSPAKRATAEKNPSLDEEQDESDEDIPKIELIPY